MQARFARDSPDVGAAGEKVHAPHGLAEVRSSEGKVADGSHRPHEPPRRVHLSNMARFYTDALYVVVEESKSRPVRSVEPAANCDAEEKCALVVEEDALSSMRHVFRG